MTTLEMRKTKKRRTNIVTIGRGFYVGPLANARGTVTRHGHELAAGRAAAAKDAAARRSGLGAVADDDYVAFLQLA